MADDFAQASSRRPLTDADLQILRSLRLDDHRLVDSCFTNNTVARFAYLDWGQANPPGHSEVVHTLMQTLLHDMRRLLFVYPRSYIDANYVNARHNPDIFANGKVGCKHLKYIVGIVLSAFVHCHRLIPDDSDDDDAAHNGTMVALQEMHTHYLDMLYLHAFLEVKTSSLSELDSMEQYAVFLRSVPQRVWMTDPRYVTDKLHIWSRLGSSSSLNGDQIMYLDRNVLCTFWRSVIFYFCYVTDVRNVQPKCNNINAAVLLLTLYNIALLEPLFTYASTLPLAEYASTHDIDYEVVGNDAPFTERDLFRFTYAGTTYAITGLLSDAERIILGPAILLCLSNELNAVLYLRTRDGSPLQQAMDREFHEADRVSPECTEQPTEPIPIPKWWYVYEPTQRTLLEASAAARAA